MVSSGLLKLYIVPVAQEVDCHPPGKSLSGADSPPVNSELTQQKEEDRKTLECDKRRAIASMRQDEAVAKQIIDK